MINGEPKSLIYDNYVFGNKDGIILLNSEGEVKHNQVVYNQRAGIHISGTTKAEVCENVVKDNICVGIWV